MKKAIEKLGCVLVFEWLVVVGLLAMACPGLYGTSPESETALVGALAANPPLNGEQIVPNGRSLVSTGQRARPAQDNDIQFEHISLEQGLGQSVVNCVLQDDKGFMWFGTQDGLDRYNGYDFVAYQHDPEDSHSLSDDFIISLYRDRADTLWIGTNNGGLNRFDPEIGHFVHYLNDPDDRYSLSNNNVLAICEDQEGSLWVGTFGGGLNRLDSETGQFTRYLNDPADDHSLGNDTVPMIYRDREGTLWVGTGGGLDRWDPDTEQFIHYRSVLTDAHTLSGDNIQAIVQDPDGDLWIGTVNAGLNRFDPESGRAIRYQNVPGNSNSLVSNAVQAMYMDRTGALWIGTVDAGLDRFDRQTKRFVHYRNDPNDPQSLSTNNVQAIYEDRSGIVWIGTFGGGLDKFDSTAKPFVRYRADPQNPNSLNSNQIWSITQDQTGVLWIGTADGGINRFDRDAGRWRHYLFDPFNPYSLSNNNVIKVYQDREGVLWAGTLGGGLNRFDREMERFIRYQNNPSDPHSLSGDNVTSILEDREGVLWVGVGVGVDDLAGAGLNRFDRETETFTHYQNDPSDPHSLSNSVVVSLYEDREGVLWVGTYGGGLNRFDRETETFTRYQNEPKNRHSLSNDIVLSIHEDRTGVLWVATFGGGLNKLNRTTGTFTRYREKDGLPNDNIYGILEEDTSWGNLWLSTNRGLSRFDPRTETFANYDVRDGLQSNEFNMNAYHKGRDGELFFGGINGFNAFYPEDVTSNPYMPDIVVTDFKLFNESVPVGEDSPLRKRIEETDAIELSYEQDFFSFEFAALHYADPAENQYAYMMEGLNKDWNYVGDRRFAGYTSVPPGDYVFRVKAASNDGVWNEKGTAIRISIAPPFWETWWFRILAGALVVGSVLGVVTWRIRSIEAQRRQLEIQVDERTRELWETLVELEESKEAAEAANRAKSAFLASVSHELRTPLNAILGFAQLMNRDEALTGEQRENLAIINRSGGHLLGLINDVLELSKIEAGRATLNEQNFDLFHLLDGLEEMFRLRAENKGLLLTFDRDPHVPRYVRMDEGKLRQVLMNLLGNAVKFTQTGRVTLRVKTQSPKPKAHPQGAAPSPSSKEPNLGFGVGAARCAWTLGFEVEDTGPGIAPEELNAVFDPFVQTASGHQSQEGTGLGLPISRQFVRLMGGTIAVDSQVGRGSVFRFVVPAAEVEMLAAQAAGSLRRAIGLEPGQPIYRLLIVDDEDVNRELLVKLFSSFGPPPQGFQVREAIDGREAVAIWEQWEPHLIWMDMRMPVMDGYEATRRIKSTTKGQATVIIALTASALEEDRVIILSEGCDGYIRKPFREAELFDALAKHLGVRFVYEETEDEPRDVSPQVGPEDANAQWIQSLATLPAIWVADLHRATVKADLSIMLSLIDQIRGQDAALADALLDLAHNFEYRKILTLIQRAGGRE